MTEDTARTIEEAKPFSEEAKAFGEDVERVLNELEEENET